MIGYSYTPRPKNLQYIAWQCGAYAAYHFVAQYNVRQKQGSDCLAQYRGWRTEAGARK